MQNNNWLKVVGIIVLVVVISLLTVKFSGSSNNSGQNLVADKVINSGEIKIGYIIYNPMLYKDQDGKLTGFSYDIVEEAAKRLGLKTKWVEEVGWGTALEGLKTHRYDLVGTQLWVNTSRAREAVFSVAIINSVMYPYGRVGETRFSDYSKMNSKDVTMITADGDLAVNVAKEDYPLAKLITLPESSPISDRFLNIVDGKADVTIIDPASPNLYMKTNPGKIERLGNTPVRTFGQSYAFARGEESMVSIWDVALRELLNDGTVARTLDKYHISNDFVINK